MNWTKIGLGTWMMESDRKASIQALRAGIDEGANHIDTAEMYGDGRVEEIVGEAIAGRRDKIILVSKVLPANADYAGTLKACERSLKRLKTDHLDCYLLHWRERSTKIAETFRAFEKLIRQGKIRAWGVSNFDVKDLEETLKLVGEEKVACNQVLYHLNERAIETKLLPWCSTHGIPIMAYSPFGQGRMPKHPVLDEIAHDHEATPGQVVLSFLTYDRMVYAIPKSSDEKRARENVRAEKIKLTAAEIARISAAFPVKPRRGLPML